MKRIVMMKALFDTVLVAALAIAAMFGLALRPASAQATNCAPIEVVIQRLADGYGEHPVSRGVASGGALVMYFASEQRGTWTIVWLAPGGPACVVASGYGYEPLKPAVGEPT